MTRKAHIVAVAICILAACEPARAQDPIFSSVPVAHNWSGFHLGAFAGGGWADVSATQLFSEESGRFYPRTDGPYGFDADGFIAGVQAGYDRQLGQFVFGVAAEVGWQKFDVTGKDPFSPPTPVPDSENYTSFESDWHGSLTARAGIAMNRLLVYARGGLAFLDASAVAVDPCRRSFCGQTTITATGSEVLFGWTAGVGMEIAITDHWTLGAEYRYYDYDDITVSGLASDLLTYTQDVGLEEVHTLRGFVNYRW